MKKGLFHRRIPTVIALSVLVIVIGISTYLIQSGIFYIGKAAPDTQPQNFSITNVTDTSFTAIFTTTGQVDAVVSINEASTGNSLVLDDRDKKSGTKNKYYSHHISVPNLTPNTQYSFKLIVGGNNYSSSSYTVKTGQPIQSAPPAQNPLFGKVLLPDGSLGSDSIVVAKTTNSQPISAITDGKGEFILPTNSLRNPQSSNYVILDSSSTFDINILRQTMSATISTVFEIAQNLPTVTLLQNYSFFGADEKIAPESSSLNFSFPESSIETVSIKRPLQDEEFIDQKPQFSGTSYPNSGVSILIPGVAQKQIITKADGSWIFQNDQPIPVGKHTFTITVKEPTGEDTKITRRFVIFPQGSQVSADDIRPTTSPSPTQRPTNTPTPTPTKTPTPTPIQQLSPTPTTTATPSATITITPPVTPTLTPTATLMPTATPTIHIKPTNLPTISPPGVMENTAVMTGISIILIIAGITLLFIL